MAFRRLFLASICAALLQGASLQSVGAQELLQNGGFEQGTAGWSTADANTAGCEAHSGSRALTLAGSGAAYAQQNLAGSVSGGTYRLSGWLKAETAATVNVALVWLDDSGSELARRARNVAAGTSYASFSLEAEAPANAHGLRVRVTPGAESNATICLDALSLDGPPLGVATPRLTATPQPTLTPTANAAAGEQESDSRPASGQSATGPVASGSAFTNGGFEQGLTGWRNFGGDLRLVGAARSGTAAAELASNTDSTKWAYQTVRVNAAQSYEFTGYLRGGTGVSTARLRISWYASTDGSGEALSTSDSAALTGPPGDYVYLTTGPVLAPTAAQSARPRVLLTPLGAGAASLLFDDLSFDAVATPQPTQAPPAATSVPEAAVPRAAAPPAAPAAVASLEPTALPPTQTSEVVAAVVAAEPAPRPPSGPLPPASNRDEGVPLIWLAAAAAFVLTLGGSYLHARRAFDRRI